MLPPESPLLRAYYYDSLPYISEAPTPEKTERLTKKERWLHAIEHLPQMCVRLGRVAMREDGTVVGEAPPAENIGVVGQDQGVIRGLPHTRGFATGGPHSFASYVLFSAPVKSFELHYLTCGS